MECIILAGGLGTRLRGVIGEQPKCMAGVNGRPFLSYLFQYLADAGCTRLILSLGYKSGEILSWYDKQPWPFTVDYVIEEEPLGTGGGIRLALESARARQVLILNGDTLFRIDLPALLRFHEAAGATATLALKPMQDFERYGIVALNEAGVITAFEEKRFRKEGLINGGVYAIDRIAFLAQNPPHKFSFEKDFLEAQAGSGTISGFPSDAYFIDIGVPVDYVRAQTDFKEMFG